MTPVRLLVIVNVYAPDLGGGILFADLCEGLADRGIEVTVRCAYPYYPEWEDKTGKNGLRIRNETVQGVKIRRYGIYIPSNPQSLWQRLLYEGSFFFSLSRSILSREQYDAIMIYCPLVGAVGFGWINRLIRRKKFWLNVQDLSADAAAASGLANPGRSTQLLSRIQSFLFNKADIVSSISPPMVRRIKNIVGNKREVLLIPNWVHRSLSDHIRPKSSTHTPDKPVSLLYSGNLGTKQNLLHFCQALARTTLSFHMEINAAGSGVSELQRWIETTNDTRFELGPLLPERDFATRLGEVDYFVITEKAEAGGSFIPSKLIPGLMSATPIWSVCSTESPLGEEASQYNFGPTMTWDILPTFLEDGSSILYDPDQYREWSRAAQKRAAFFNRDRLIDVYEEEIKRWIGR